MILLVAVAGVRSASAGIIVADPTEIMQQALEVHPVDCAPIEQQSIFIFSRPSDGFHIPSHAVMGASSSGLPAALPVNGFALPVLVQWFPYCTDIHHVRLVVFRFFRPPRVTSV